MADWDAGDADALSRLEAALDRIATHRQRASAPDSAPAIDVAGIASRLDTLIGRLRHALATEA